MKLLLLLMCVYLLRYSSANRGHGPTIREGLLIADSGKSPTRELEPQQTQIGSRRNGRQEDDYQERREKDFPSTSVQNTGTNITREVLRREPDSDTYLWGDLDEDLLKSDYNIKTNEEIPQKDTPNRDSYFWLHTRGDKKFGTVPPMGWYEDYLFNVEQITQKDNPQDESQDYSNEPDFLWKDKVGHEEVWNESQLKHRLESPVQENIANRDSRIREEKTTEDFLENKDQYLSKQEPDLSQNNRGANHLRYQGSKFYLSEISTFNDEKDTYQEVSRGDPQNHFADRFIPVDKVAEGGTNENPSHEEKNKYVMIALVFIVILILILMIMTCLAIECVPFFSRRIRCHFEQDGVVRQGSAEPLLRQEDTKEDIDDGKLILEHDFVQELVVTQAYVVDGVNYYILGPK